MHRVGRFVICVFDRSDRDAAQEFLWFKVYGTGLVVDDCQSYESLTWRYLIGACHGAENMIRIQGGLVLAGSVQFRLVMAGFVLQEEVCSSVSMEKTDG